MARERLIQLLDMAPTVIDTLFHKHWATDDNLCDKCKEEIRLDVRTEKTSSSFVCFAELLKVAGRSSSQTCQTDSDLEA